MLLNEFFGRAIDLGHKDEHGKLADDAFWFILDHDRIHKEHFHSLAPKIKEAHSSGSADKEKLVKEFMPWSSVVAKNIIITTRCRAS